MRIEYEKEHCRTAAYDGEMLIGECSYVEVANQYWNLNHTFVNKQYAGQGIAKKLVESLLIQARKAGVKIQPECSYVLDYFKKHEEQSDLLK